MPWAYIVECSDESFYVGSTVNLENRIVEHNRGEGARYTARRRPVQLVWAAEFERVDEAFAYEKRVQGWSRQKRIALIEGRYADLPELAKKHGITWRMRQQANSEPGADGVPASLTGSRRVDRPEGDHPARPASAG